MEASLAGCVSVAGLEESVTQLVTQLGHALGLLRVQVMEVVNKATEFAAMLVTALQMKKEAEVLEEEKVRGSSALTGPHAPQQPVVPQRQQQDQSCRQKQLQVAHAAVALSLRAAMQALEALRAAVRETSKQHRRYTRC